MGFWSRPKLETCSCISRPRLGILHVPFSASLPPPFFFAASCSVQGLLSQPRHAKTLKTSQNNTNDLTPHFKHVQRKTASQCLCLFHSTYPSVLCYVYHNHRVCMYAYMHTHTPYPSTSLHIAINWLVGSKMFIKVR